MTVEKSETKIDPEIAAIGAVYSALQSLEKVAQQRALEYVARKLGIRIGTDSHAGESQSVERLNPSSLDQSSHPESAYDEVDPEISDEISPIAQKWMQRNSLEPNQLAALFSLGGEEIDVIAEKIPGKSKRERMRHVIYLKCIAAYLASGAARVSDKHAREACLHYDALDSANFAANIKSFGAYLSGTKQAGYTLTPRGISEATKIVKEMSEMKG